MLIKIFYRMNDNEVDMQINIREIEIHVQLITRCLDQQS
jgi:hypothetical protein